MSLSNKGLSEKTVFRVILSHMNKRIDWTKVLEAHTLKTKGGFKNAEIARKMKVGRRQVLRFLSYWEREDNPHKNS